ncbi:MAG: hypothetical protein ACQEQX_06420 [Thermodesulfobacteriota bacterium]
MTNSFSPKQEETLDKLAQLYAEMEQAYNRIAGKLGLSCATCTQNCCSSYFQHHTYLEWAYLWRGLQQCPPESRKTFQERAQEYVRQSQSLLQKGLRPNIMCPLNHQGWCSLYPYRLMICRLHGVPNQVLMPNKQLKRFPGCQQSQKLTASLQDPPVLDRTAFYTSLAELETELLSTVSHRLPRVKLTLAEMICQGRPRI